jgi:mRNA-degrading endonuclease RelE of RelBE toxin-antitoxin system
MFAVDWRPRALRQLRRIRDARPRTAIVLAVGSLRSFPTVEGIVALTAHRHGYRLRVGHYRVLFDVDKEDRVVVIQEVRKRDERTY